MPTSKGQFYDLERIQRWMQAAIMHPGGIVDGIASSQAREHLDIDPQDIEQVLTRSQAMSAVDRLEVYGNAYYARLIECLREEFPVLRQALGEDAFDAFAVGYLQNYPSRTYTLIQLGSKFAQYLAETSPPADDEMPVHWIDFVVDLAQFELAVSEVFDGPGSEGQPLLDVQQLLTLPQSRILDVRLECVDCLRLIRLNCPVHRYYDAVRCNQHPTPPGPEETHLALTRRKYVVHHHELSKTGYELLTRLVAGASLGTALEDVMAGSQVSSVALAPNLRTWFLDWSAAGFFRRAHLPD
ncbi:MAG: putative DNA-binding domain-containing protein [Planctomycetia bacterium]|nr:putative DNA-binding domain-containing protein [Planctomycetia bacterium]